MTTSEYQELDQVRHMLAHPERDLGDTTVHPVVRYLLDLDTMSLSAQEMPYNTAVERLYQEILYNAIDNAERSRKEGIDPGTIKVWMSKDTIRIRNEGKPIPCGIQPNRDIHKPEFIFSNLLTGSNFGGEARKVQTVGGRFGIGGKAANIFSTFFNIEIGNAVEKVKYKQTWKNNMYVAYRPEEGDSQEIKQKKQEEYRKRVAPTIEPYEGTSYTQVTFIADFAKFYDDDVQFGFAGQRAYTPGMLMAYAKHCADASATGNVKVYFNNKEIDCTDFNDQGEYELGLGVLKYARLYFPELPSHLLFKSDDSICLILDTPGNGTTISFVNGVINEEGGVHVDSWRKTLFKGIITHFKKKFKINEKMISSHISMILFCRLPNPKYKSQTKDKVTSPKPQTTLKDVDGNAIDIRQVLEWEAVQKIEEIIRAQINAIAKKTDGDKKKLVDSDKLMDAYHAGGPESEKCTLLITEGDGAANVAIKSIEDGGYTGALPIKGKLLNVSKVKEVSTSTLEGNQYSNNVEIREIKKALGLKEGTDYSTVESRKQLRYGRLIIMTDQDRDGAHIRMLVINFFRHKFPSLLEPTNDGSCPSFVSIMETPYIRVKDSTKMIPFFYEKEYDDWINDPSVSESERQKRRRSEVKIYKGLGSSSDMEIMEAMHIGKIMVPRWDEKAEELMAIAFDEGNEDERKEWLMSWDPIKKEGAHAKNFEPDTISHLITNQLCEFSWVNALRSTPNIVDGLKECQRKVLAVVLGLAKPKKVSQLKGLVSDQMHYRYGDEALYRTIVGMGNYCVGTNNIPLIKAMGQYDSRLGKKAAPDRYIFAARSPILKYMFRKEDECILEYLYEGKDKIEPMYYYPILPVWAVNGSRGIGTGFSTNIPAHKPIDVMKYIIWWLKLRTGQITASPSGKIVELPDGNKRVIPYEAPPELAPWYRNYQGKIVKSGNDWYSVGKFEVIQSRKRVKDILVTEIPVTQTIKTYTEKLKKLKEKPIMKNWTGMDTTGKSTKCPTWITGYKPVPKRMTYTYKGEKYIEVLPCIQIEGPLCATTVEAGPIRALGLMEKISDTNITLLDDKSRPRQYGGRKTCVRDENGEQAYVVSGIMNAMDNYCQIRYDAYVRRRQEMMKFWQEKIEKLELQKKFIQDVVDEKIKFKGTNNKMKRKNILIKEIEQLGYPADLADISIFSLTEDGIEKVNDEISKFQEKYNTYKKTSPAQLWVLELEQLFDHL